jgi:hypothetical protein
MFLRAPTERLEQATYMVHMIMDAEALLHQPRQLRAGPQVDGESSRLCATQQFALQSARQQSDLSSGRRLSIGGHCAAGISHALAGIFKTEENVSRSSTNFVSAGART